MNPCVFYHPELDYEVEIHGDDFLGGGLRSSALVVEKQLKDCFLVKQTTIISPNPADEQEGHFLKRKITVDEHGYHMQLDTRYAEDLVYRLGLADGKSVVTPGSKECGKSVKEKPLSPQAHREYRGGAGVAQYMSDMRIDCTFSTKELMRDAAAPTEVSAAQLKRLGRYVKGRM